MLKTACVKDYMSANLVTFTPDMDIHEAISQLIRKSISGAPVVDRIGDLVGMLTERDCMKIALTSGYHAESTGKVVDYMHPAVATVDADDSIVEVATLFLQEDVRRFPVMKDNRLIGQISRHDVLKALELLR